MLRSRFFIPPTILLLLLISFVSSGQYQITGRLVAPEGPLPYAEVILLDTLERFIGGVITDEGGRFVFPDVSTGNYLLKTSMLGYQPIQQVLTVEQSTVIGEIVLRPSATQLETVTVTAQKRLIEQQADRLIFRVENSVAALGGTGLAALELTPGVQVQNGVLSIIGRGTPAVLLDGRLLQLTGPELVDFLTSLAADDIASIEVITNPPAKYAAAGQGGLLNIVLKRGRANSWKSNTNLGGTQAVYGATNLGTTFLLNRDQLQVSASATSRLGYIQKIERIDVAFPDSRWRTLSITKDREDQLSGRLAIDYKFTDRLTVGGQYLGSHTRPDFAGPIRTRILQPNGRLDSTLVNQQHAQRPVTNHVANFHGSLDLDTLGRSVSLNLDYFQYGNSLQQTNEVSALSLDNNFLGLDLSQLTFSDQQIKNVNLQLDVEHPFAGWKLDYGTALTFTTTPGSQRTFSTIYSEPVFDPNLSNEFDYTENVQALYANASGKGSDQWDWQAGLRLENTQTETYSATQNQRTVRNYAKLFPTLYVAYRPSEHSALSISYGRRINRPSFRNLNPTRIYINSNSYSEGNPFLQPSFTDLLDLNHTWRSKLRTNLFFNRTVDGHGPVFTADPADLSQRILRRNYFTSYFFGVSESYTWEPTTWWTSQNQAFLIGGITTTEAEFAIQEQNGVQVNLRSDNTLTFGKGTKLQVNAFYNSPTRANIFRIAAIYGVTLGVQQTINESFQVSLLVNDIFNTANLRSLISTVNGVTTDYGENYATRYVRLTVSYNFGNEQVEVRKREFGNEEVQRRL